MIIYKIQMRNFDVQESPIELGFYLNQDDAIEAAFKYVESKRGIDPELKQPEPHNYKYYIHVAYKSYYGNYNCGVEIIPIILR